jgi:hypothetical protein
MGQTASCFRVSSTTASLIAAATWLCGIAAASACLTPAFSSLWLTDTDPHLGLLQGPAVVTTKSSSSGKDAAVLCPSSSSNDSETTPTESSSSVQQGPPAVDPTIAACCLGAASQPGGSYDPTQSGPPLPGCEADRWVCHIYASDRSTTGTHQHTPAL